MIGATPDGARRRRPVRRRRRRDHRHRHRRHPPRPRPELRRRAQSRNFTMDIPAIDGPCEVATCIDPADVDDGGHGTHVAGTVAAADNGIGILRRGPRRHARQRARRPGLRLLLPVRDGRGPRVRGRRRARRGQHELLHRPVALQLRLGRRLRVRPGHRRTSSRSRRWSRRPWTAAWSTPTTHGRHAGRGGRQRAHRPGPADPGRRHSSPDYPAGAEPPATVTSDCLDLPSEGPQVHRGGSVGPSATKADYSNYGLRRASTSRLRAAGSATSSAPRKFSDAGQPGAVVVPAADAPIEEGLADPTAFPVDDFSRPRAATAGAMTAASTPTCRAPRWRRRTSPAWPPWSSRRTAGQRPPRRLAGPRLGAVPHRARPPRHTPARLAASRTTPTRAGRPTGTRRAQGTTDDNGLYGEGIVNAAAAAGRPLT